MTEVQLREKVVAQARSWLGRKEADGSHREIIDVYNSIKPLPNGYRMKYTDPWCAAFVSAVAWMCKLTSIIIPSASCPDMVAKYQKIGRWMENDNYLPRAGDVVFYDWDDSGSGDNAGVPDHVGLVTDVYSTSFNVIEGNSSDMVKIRTLQRNARYLRGFGLPDYAGAATEKTEEDGKDIEAPTTSSGDYQLTYHLLRHGAGMGEQAYLKPEVAAVQKLLIADGYTCGGYGADGEFGSGTEQSVRNYQYDHKLEADGVVGPQTRAKLEGVSVP
jgi:hypothetical protein